MRTIIIEGLWFCVEKVCGIRRYAFEIIKNIDSLLDEKKKDVDVRIVYPSFSKIHIDGLYNIQIIKLEVGNRRYHSSVLREYVKQNNGILCCFGEEISYCRNQIVCMHDIRALETKEYDDNRIRMHLEKWSAKLMNSTIVTVSEYQKRHICKEYRLPENKVFVMSNGWEHVTEIIFDENVFLRHPEIWKDDYYYAIGSVAKHKNYKWIHEMAKKYKDKQFVIAGNIDKNIWGVDESELHLPNVIFTGYVSDGENKALMQHCRALLHPSKYEGFGIPPLEALALGKKIIISNATCLPEIYGESAAYFDPDDYDVDLDDLESKSVRGGEKVLEKYTWRNSAEKWLELFMLLGGSER